MTAATITVCSLDAMATLVRDTAASHVISLINAPMMPTTPPLLAPQNHLKLSMNDVNAPVEGCITPSAQHIEQLIAFVEQWDRNHPLLIHCWAGISRSTAAAFITLCALNPSVDEPAIAGLLRQKSPSATPNSLLVSEADHHLAREGRMIRAIADIGRGQTASVGAPFTLPAILDNVA